MKSFTKVIEYQQKNRVLNSIIDRREIQPMLAKAGQILSYYDEALGVSAVLRDKTGSVVGGAKSKEQMRFCKFCRKYSKNLNREIKEYPCEKIHGDALAVSRQMDETRIYTCPAGFVYWTTPLYRKGRYAGALTAGQVLPVSRKEACEKFRQLYKSEEAEKEFLEMIESTEEKDIEEIQAMAQLMEVCAEEISEKEESPKNAFPRRILAEGDSKEASKTKYEVWKKDGGDEKINAESLNSEFIIEKERVLLAAFRRGDIETGEKILKEAMAFMTKTASFDLDIIRCRAIEIIVLLSRAASGNVKNSRAVLEENNRYLRCIRESKTPKEILENLQFITERMAGKVFSFHGVRHSSVLRRAERYIWENYTRKISLEEISKASGLSAPYFSTIFKEEMGENLSVYLNRLRIEKAANMLIASGKPLNEIAETCGFEDQSWFSKIFKKFTGMSPGKYRETGNLAPAFSQHGAGNE